MLAFVWFAFNRSFDREKESLQAELRGELQSDFVAESQKLREVINSDLTKQDQRITKLTTSTAEDVQSIIGEVQFVKGIVESLSTNLTEIAEKSAQNVAKRFFEKLRQLELDLAFLELYHWRSKEVWGNVLSSGLKVLELSISLKKEEWFYNMALEEIEKSLKLIDSIYQWDYNNIVNIMNSLPVDLKSRAASISDLAKSKLAKD